MIPICLSRMVPYYRRILHEHRLPVYPIVAYISPEDADREVENTQQFIEGDKYMMTFNYEVAWIWELETGTEIIKGVPNYITNERYTS